MRVPTLVFAMEFCAVESCGKCTPCLIGSVRGVETIDRIAAGDGDAIHLTWQIHLRRRGGRQLGVHCGRCGRPRVHFGPVW